MKKSLVTLLILVSAFVLLCAVALYTTKVKKEKQMAMIPREKLFDIKDENGIKKYELVFDNNYITVEKKEEGWFVVSPTNYYADQMEAFANVKNFNTLQIDTIVTNLAEKDLFGLENPMTKFTIIDDGMIHTLYVGSKTADNEKYYVQYNGEYFTVEWVYIDALKKDITMLRNKDFLAIRPEEVVSIMVYSNNMAKRMTRDGTTNYTLIGVATNLNLNRDMIYNDFNEIIKTQAIGFIPDGAGPRSIGINNRFLTRVDLVMEDKSIKTFYLARSFLDKKTYAITDRIYEVEYTLFDSAGRRVTEYIVK